MPEEKGKDLPDDKVKEVLRTMLLSERDYNARYHDHKEKMGWAATALYLGGLIALYKGNVECKNGLFLLVLSTSILLFFFICKLFSDREISANIVAACTTLLTRLNTPGFIITECMRCPTELNQLGYKYPKILIDEINDRSLRKPPRNWYFHNWYFLLTVCVLILWTVVFLLKIKFQ
ncbi:MAG: hypothetical protein ABSB32_10405 [Thermodesulfobacteriota bacterium]|jgi:phage-related holin